MNGRVPSLLSNKKPSFAFWRRHLPSNCSSPFQKASIFRRHCSLSMALSSTAKFTRFPTSVSVPSIPNPCRSSQCSILSRNSKHKAVSFHSRIYDSPSLSSTKRRGSLSVECTNAKSSASEAGGGDGDQDGALKTVLKLYTALKNKNISELSEVIVDECRRVSVSNFFPFRQVFRGKSQVLDFYSRLMKNWGNNLVFMVHPTIGDGTTVGFKWKIAWNNTLVPLGKGFSIHSSHSLGGKLLLGNLEMIMEPLLQLNPMRLKTVCAIVEKINMNWVPKEKSRRAASLALGFFLLLSLFFLQFSFR